MICKPINFLMVLLSGLVTLNCSTRTEIWSIGDADNSAGEFALAPDNFRDFVARDFGYEDKYYLIGYSKENEDFPYVIPGPVDTWGGTWPTSGWRTSQVNILFGIERLPSKGNYKLVVEILDHAKKFLPLVKVSINEQERKFQLTAPGFEIGNQPQPKLNEPLVEEKAISGDTSRATPKTIEIPIEKNILKKGGNFVSVTVLEGSWIMFDQIRLEGPQIRLIKPNQVFIRDVRPAEYEIDNEGVKIQPLLVNLEHLDGVPDLTVEVDGEIIFSQVVEERQYEFEAPMSAVTEIKKSKYRILIDGKEIESGTVTRSPQKIQTLADYVDTRIGTAHSRWMIAPGPWMPFSMVKMSPDNQNKGWQAGYDPSFESIGCFSHIHEWTMAGIGMMPTNGELQVTVGDQLSPDSGYRSRIDKTTEEAPIGYYKVFLSDTRIWAEVTATMRCGFQRYTFPQDKDGRIMVDLHIQAEYDYHLPNVEINKVDDYTIEGKSHQISPRPTVWSNDADQEYTVHFVIEFDQPIKKMGGWLDDKLIDDSPIKGVNLKEAGVYVEFDTKKSQVVQARSGISLVSVENARENLETEISTPFGWDFGAIAENQKKTWNNYFSRIKITSDNRLEKMRFYNNFYRSMCRNTWSDVNREWIAADGKKQKLAHPDHLALGCDAFWNTFWNLNQFWNLVTPEWSSKWVNSQLAMYDANGWLAKGPAGMKYIPVMVAEHEIPLIVGAYQMGIRDFDAEKAFQAVKKMQTTPAQPVAGGFAGNRDLVPYQKYRYVPSDLGRFSNTLEYAYDDWTVAQFAKALGKVSEYRIFAERGSWWRNAFNSETGYAQLRESTGSFVEPFDPFHSGRNHHYVEGNAWQLSFFVPQDVPQLAELIGQETFVDRLNWGFEASEPWRFNAPNDQYWDYPVVQGNQQSMHFAFLFNWVEHPWLTQKWSRSVLERYYGHGVANAYLGDEDQGQMSAWFIMASIGLFQTDGGCRTEPVYEIASPLYEKIVIDLGEQYNRGKQFVIEAKNVSRKNKYVQSAELNGKKLNAFWFPASELLKGGSLILNMGDTPNKNWGVKSIPPNPN